MKIYQALNFLCLLAAEEDWVDGDIEEKKNESSKVMKNVEEEESRASDDDCSQKNAGDGDNAVQSGESLIEECEEGRIYNAYLSMYVGRYLN